MHVISRKKLVEFSEQHPLSKPSLDVWFRIVSKTDFASFVALRKTFPHSDQVQDLTVFNIAGNKYRLISAIHYNRRTVYIRRILTHSEYAKNRWRTP